MSLPQGVVLECEDTHIGDICFYDRYNKSSIFVRREVYNPFFYPKERYEPIGIVVVPSNHNRYTTKCSGMVAFCGISTMYPDRGAHGKDEDGTEVRRGLPLTELPLTHYKVVPKVQMGRHKPYIEELVDCACLPSEIIDSNKMLRWHYHTMDKDCAPFPLAQFYSTYNEEDALDGEPNKDYDNFKGYNALSDFSGKENTAVMCQLSIMQEDWKVTHFYISEYDDKGFFPIACCCWRYMTKGTQQGDWYLPALGELGYLFVFYATIEKIMSKVAKDYSPLYYTNKGDLKQSNRYSPIPNFIINTEDLHYLMISSTQYDDVRFWFIDTQTGSFYHYEKDKYDRYPYVHPFFKAEHIVSDDPLNPLTFKASHKNK